MGLGCLLPPNIGGLPKPPSEIRPRVVAALPWFPSDLKLAERSPVWSFWVNPSLHA